MRKAKMQINDDVYYGYLTIAKLMDVKENYPYSYTELSKRATEGDTEILSDLVFESLEDKTAYTYLLELGEAERFATLKLYANTLLKLTFPLNEVEEASEDEDEFEDMPGESNDSDWDIPWMQYTWESILKRDNFYEITPRMFYEQLEVHKKLNNIEDKKTEVL